MFDWFSTPVPQSDLERGREALKFFHNRACMYSGYKARSLDDLISQAGGKQPQIFLDAFGMAIREVGLGSGPLQDTMENLADQGQGKIPSNNYAWFRSLSDRAQNITFRDWLVAAPEIVGNTALDARKGLVAVGDAVIYTGKSLLTIAPIMIVGAVVFIFVMRTKQIAGK